MGEMINTCMYLTNKYTKWYHLIIANARGRINGPGYFEKHHIIPRSLGGSKTHKDNIVSLTPKEHFICHLLLTKMVTGQYRYKMMKALTMLMGVKNIGKGRYIACSRWYLYAREQNKENIDIFWTEERRKEHSDKLKLYNQILDKNSEKEINRRKSISESQKNKIWTETAISSRTENLRKSAENRKGQPWPANRRKAYEDSPPTQPESANIARSKKLKGRKTSSGNTGHRHTDDTKNKMRLSGPSTIFAVFRSPAGDEVECIGINKFSKDYSLNVGTVRTMIGDTSKEYKGWVFLRFLEKQ